MIFPKTASAELYTVEIDDGSGWTATASTAAYGKSIYSVLVPTTKDSTAESDGLINFRVIAAMNEGNYTSQEMTGYSVDNLAPVVPQGLLGKLSGSVIELSWQENLDNDFKYYTIYRGDNGSQLQAIRTSIQPVFNDQDITAGHDYSYALSATDHSCNESALSETINLTVTALDEVSAIPDKYYLGQNFPNPFNPTTTITFGLKESTKVRLMVYDILGNQVAELVNTIFPAGRYQVEWDGTNSFSAMAGTGIYYYKLETEKYSSVKKMIYIK